MKKMIAAMVAATLGLSTAAFAQAVPPASQAPSPNCPICTGGGIGAGAAAGALASLIVLGIALSDDDESGTTTTTTTN